MLLRNDSVNKSIAEFFKGNAPYSPFDEVRTFEMISDVKSILSRVTDDKFLIRASIKELKEKLVA